MLRSVFGNGILKKISIGTLIIAGGTLSYDSCFNDFLYSGATKRFIRSLGVATLISKDYYFVMKKEGTDLYESLLKQTHQKSADRILEACLKNGGLYIKIGQGVSAINHILPVEYTKTLSQLQDKCLPSSKKDIVKVFIKDFGNTPENIFKEFDYNPIAAASLAQVFRGKLKSGEKVAIKVQYNNLDRRFSTDIGTLIFLQNMIEFFFKDYNFGWILKDLRENLEKELNFCNEGKNAEQCWRDLHHISNVYVPKIKWKYTTKRILTMEWIDGFSIMDFPKLKQNNISLKQLDRKLFDVFSEQIFNTGFVHGDPHPGNLLVRCGKNGVFDIVILDHGLYEHVPFDVRQNLCLFWESTVLRDEKSMRRAAENLNIHFYKDFAEVLFQVPYESRTGTIKTKLSDKDIEYMQEIAKKHFDKIMQTLKEMPSNLLFVVRNLNTIRAISREHGDPLDRPKTMARYAQKCLWKNQSFFGFFIWIFRRLRFEFQILRQHLRTRMLSLFLDSLHLLGRSTKTSKEIFEMIKQYQNFEE